MTPALSSSPYDERWTAREAVESLRDGRSSRTSTPRRHSPACGNRACFAPSATDAQRNICACTPGEKSPQPPLQTRSEKNADGFEKLVLFFQIIKLSSRVNLCLKRSICPAALVTRVEPQIQAITASDSSEPATGISAARCVRIGSRVRRAPGCVKFPGDSERRIA